MSWHQAQRQPVVLGLIKACSWIVQVLQWWAQWEVDWAAWTIPLSLSNYYTVMITPMPFNLMLIMSLTSSIISNKIYLEAMGQQSLSPKVWAWEMGPLTLGITSTLRAVWSVAANSTENTSWVEAAHQITLLFINSMIEVEVLETTKIQYSDLPVLEHLTWSLLVKLIQLLNH